MFWILKQHVFKQWLPSSAFRSAFWDTNPTWDFYVNPTWDFGVIHNGIPFCTDSMLQKSRNILFIILYITYSCTSVFYHAYHIMLSQHIIIVCVYLYINMYHYSIIFYSIILLTYDTQFNTLSCVHYYIDYICYHNVHVYSFTYFILIKFYYPNISLLSLAQK